MATIPIDKSPVMLFGSEVNSWSNLQAGDDGQPVGTQGSGDRTIQVQGTFGVGGTVLLEGTIDNVNWYTLRDPSGSLLSFTGAGLKAVLENVLALRPRVSSGDGSTNLQVYLLTRSPRNG